MPAAVAEESPICSHRRIHCRRWSLSSSLNNPKLEEAQRQARRRSIESRGN
jgi:hypothetical protein